jgi:uridine kinase
MGGAYMLRSQLISELANKILSLRINHPVRVGVSGITASGKTTLANELAKELLGRNKKVIRTSIDNFHNPRDIRYKKGKESAIGYYEDAHDYESFKQRLLIPLGPNENLHYQTISLDLVKDEYVNTEMKVATKDMVLIVDGTFLFKKNLCNLYDFKIFVNTDFELARKRGAKREERAFGSYEEAEKIFIKRYHAASKLYLDQHSPQLNADVVINNNNINNPDFV